MHTSNHVVLITGGASGIGLALAKKFVAENNKVIITGRNFEKLLAVKQTYPTIDIELADVNNEQDVSRLVEKYKEVVTILINNAGIQYNYEFCAELDGQHFIKHELDTNVYAPIKLTHLFGAHLLAKETAAIINISSGLGLVPKKSAPVYCSTKAAIHIFTKALRYQLASTSVKVFEIIPPLVDTDMTKGRGSGKISPEQLADEFWSAFKKDKYEVYIGKAKLLKVINRFLPKVAENILKKS